MDFCLSLQCLESLVKIAQGCVDEELPIDACTLAFQWQVQILSLLAGSSFGSDLKGFELFGPSLYCAEKMSRFMAHNRQIEDLGCQLH